MGFFEFIKEVFDSFKERLKNQFIGAFIISWVICNWEAVFVLMFSETPMEVRISHVRELYSDSIYNILLPGILAFSYTAGLPWLMNQFDQLTSKSLENRRENFYGQKMHQVDQKILLAKRERQLEDVKSGNKTIEELNSKISQLQQTVKTKNIENVELNKRLESSQKEMENELTKLHEYSRTRKELSERLNILEIDAEIRRETFGNSLVHYLVEAYDFNNGRVKLRDENQIDYLLNLGLIKREVEDEEKIMYWLTTIGKGFVEYQKSRENKF